jgi:Fic family protein
MKRWIWEMESYPNFTYDLKKLQRLIEDISREQGYLIAISQTISSEVILQRQSEALISEAIGTSAIEGEILNRDSVKASIAKKFGFKDVEYKKINETTDNLIEILIDANSNYNQDLTLERLFGWHNALFPKGYSGWVKINTAEFRGEETMQVVGGGIGKEKVYYEAPPRKNLEEEMKNFLEWFNTAEVSLLKASIAHLWFVIIHPFDDGNGRITRAITDLVLSKIENTTISRLYSMSNAINEDRNGYYKALEHTTGFIQKENPLDITIWCEWFLKTLLKALLEAKTKFNSVTFKTKFWDKYRDKNLNGRQIKVLNFILDIGIEEFKGNLSKKKYMSLANCPSTNASRDLVELLELGCIRQIEGTSGRNISYEIDVSRVMG